jgi:hypothetical protein
MFAQQDQDTDRSARPRRDASYRRPERSRADTLAAAIAMIAAPAIPVMSPAGGASAAAPHHGGGHAATGFFRLGRRRGKGR